MGDAAGHLAEGTELFRLRECLFLTLGVFLRADVARDCREECDFPISFPMGDDDLPLLDALMHQYRDRPMDFADATLVRIAERESLSLILTIDHDDFETYRFQGRRRFRIVPGRAPGFKR